MVLVSLAALLVSWYWQYGDKHCHAANIDHAIMITTTSQFSTVLKSSPFNSFLRCWAGPTCSEFLVQTCLLKAKTLNNSRTLKMNGWGKQGQSVLKFFTKLSQSLEVEEERRVVSRNVQQEASTRPRTSQTSKTYTYSTRRSSSDSQMVTSPLTSWFVLKHLYLKGSSQFFSFSPQRL